MNRDKENGVHVRVLAPAPTTRRKNRRKNKPKMTVREQELANRVITSVHRGLKKTRVIKYYDFILLNQTSSSTVGFANLTQIPQGPGQSQRIADTIWIQKIDVRFYAYEMESTTDYTNYLRISFFTWKENTASVAPSSVQIYQNATSFSVLSPFTFETRALYAIHRDWSINLSGYVGVPTNGSQHQIIDSISLGEQRIDYNIGVTSGINHFFFVNYSDSLLSPFPMYSMQTRVWYYDE